MHEANTKTTPSQSLDGGALNGSWCCKVFTAQGAPLNGGFGDPHLHAGTVKPMAVAAVHLHHIIVIVVETYGATLVVLQAETLNTVRTRRQLQPRADHR